MHPSIAIGESPDKGVDNLMPCVRSSENITEGYAIASIRSLNRIEYILQLEIPPKKLLPLLSNCEELNSMLINRI